jgi:hypothetical protein
MRKDRRGWTGTKYTGRSVSYISRERHTYTFFDILTRDVYVHTPETSNQIHRTWILVTVLRTWRLDSHQDSTQCCQLGENIINLIVGVRHLDRDLGEVIRVGSRKNLFVMIQILGHGDQMILSGQSCTSRFIGRTYLNIREIEPNVGLRSHKPLLVTSLGQSFYDIRLVTHQSQQTHDLLSACSDSASSARLSESCAQDLPPQHVTLFGILDNQD